MDRTENMQQTVSDLADGQLQSEAFAHALELLDRDADARATWLSYQVIGDVLRSPELAPATDSAAFVSRLRSRLAAEAAPVAVSQPVVPAEPVAPVVLTVAATPSANAANWRWKLAAGFASVAAVAAIGWNMVGGMNSQPARAELAQSAPVAPATTLAAEQATPAMIRDPRLDELLAAHRQNGGASALQGPSGFLRNATFEAPSR